MFKLLKNAFNIKEIRLKILFTIFILFIFRLGSHITVPGVDAHALSKLQDVSFLNLLSLTSGGGMQNFSVFAMGVSPYITSSIIIQMLQMDIVPKFVEWSKQGEVGRKKLNQVTRYLTLIIAFLQSVGITTLFNGMSQQGLVPKPTVGTFILIGLILTTGTMFITWLGEQITEKGFGNGVSMIIFAGIISSVPSSVRDLWNDYFVNISPSDLLKSIIFVIALLLAIIAIVTATTFVQQAERKIPIQYTKRIQGAPTSSYLPLKVNAAGVIPVIFASSIVTIPSAVIQTLSTWIPSLAEKKWVDVMTTIFSYQTLPGSILYALLIVGFTFFYAFVQVNPEKLAENLQKQGSYIPRVRPGKGTEEYVSKLLMRLSTVGAIFLGVIALLPIIASMLIDESKSALKGLGLGGTSLLIIIGVALEAAKQLEGLMLKRKYVGFINTEE
ncbi:MAG: preprotein translocase subunit SecY [Streptococcaceae bacterium]|jgi:preprotein translocase subunit SecY|nr:preprotein translocase subunit SecY [Streptococcaceae bacterium]